MPYDLSKLLVIGVSSSALFDLQEEDRIFQEQGLLAFIDYQLAHEDEVLRPGSAFPLIKGMLALNTPKNRKVEVILMSRNHPDVSLRVFNSIRHHALDITRAALTGGAPLGAYLGAFKVGLFLSKTMEDVQSAANEGLAAGLVYPVPPGMALSADEIRVAFDCDRVIFSGDAQKVYDEQGLEAFYRHEETNAKTELAAGSFAKLLRNLSEIEGTVERKCKVRLALVTDRNSPAHKRVILTLRKWGVRIDETFFLGGLSKANFVKAFRAQMFFDDKEEYCKLAANEVPTSQVLQPLPQPTLALQPDIEITVKAQVDGEQGEKRFLAVSKSYLKRDFAASEAELKEWFGKIRDWPEADVSAFLDEFEESARGTPSGLQRRATGKNDSPGQKIIAFLDELANKRRRG